MAVVNFALSADIDNEKLILAGALQNESLYHLFSSLPVQVFAGKQHSVIAQALLNAQRPVSNELLLIHCKRISSSLPTEEYLDHLRALPCPDKESYQKHLDFVREDFYRRQIEDDLLPRLIQTLATKSEPLSRVSDIATQMRTLATRGEGSVVLSTQDILQRYTEVEQARRNREDFFSCGYATLDQFLTRGFFPTGVSVVAGRPGMGKSSFIINSMMRLSAGYPHAVPVLLFSLEMSMGSVIDRILSRLARFPLDRLTKHFFELTPTELQRYQLAKEQLLRNTRLFITDKTGVSLSWIRDQVQRFQEKYQVGYCVVFIDLFGKVTDLRESNLAASYEIALNNIQSIARELNVHFVLVAQISRVSESGRSIWAYRPELRELKNSGAWEEVADNVFLLFRAKYYDESLEDDVLEVRIAKQRDGEANVEAYFEFVGPHALILDTDVVPYDKRGKGDGFKRSPDSQGVATETASIVLSRHRDVVDEIGSIGSDSERT